MVSVAEEFHILEDYNPTVPDVSTFLSEENMHFEYLASMSVQPRGYKLIYRSCMTDEDALFLSIKYPDLEIKKINK